MQIPGERSISGKGAASSKALWLHHACLVRTARGPVYCGQRDWGMGDDIGL